MRRCDKRQVCTSIRKRRWAIVGPLAGALFCALRAPCYAVAQTDTLSREVTVWNNPNLSAIGFTDTLSRETTIWNDPRISTKGPTDTLTREITVWNDPRVSIIGLTDTLTREVTVQAGPVPQKNGATALRVAGGLVVVTSGQMSTLNVETTGASAGRVDIRDAVRLARKAAGLDP